MKNLFFLSNIALSGTPARKMLNEVEHLVIPAIGIKQGVLNGVYYPAEELESFHNTWNGVPVPVNHPTVHGNPVTANSTEVEDTYNIGTFYNVQFEDDAVKGEIWINITKAEKLGFGDIVTQLESGEMMEVSTGLHAFTRDEVGVYNGTPYTKIIDSIRPDHLALLPDTEGACSIKDGCGAMRANKDEPVINCGGDTSCACNKPEPVKGTWVNRLRGWFGLNTDKSFQERSRLVSQAVDAAHGKDAYIYTVKTYDNYTIFEMGPSLYKQNYTISGDTVTLQGERIEVTTEISYIPVTNENDNKNLMNPTKRLGLVNALALALVANNAQAVTDKSKTDLGALPDEMLANMAAAYNLNEDGSPTVQTPVAAPAPIVETNNQLAPEKEALLDRLLANEKQRVTDKAIQLGNARKDLAPEVIATFNEAALDAMLGSAGIVANTNFSPAAGGSQTPTPAPYRAPSVYLANDNKEEIK